MTVALCSGPNNPDNLNFDDVITKVYNPNTVLIGGVKKNVTICVSYRDINYVPYPSKERATSVYEVMYRYKVQQVTYLITLRITNQRGVRSDYSEGSGTANGTDPMPYTCSMIPVYRELDKYNEYNPGTTPRTIDGGAFPWDQFTPDNGDDYFGLPHWYDIEYKIDTGDTNTGGGTTCDQNSNIDNPEQAKIKRWLREHFRESQWGYNYCDSEYCVRTVCIQTSQLTLVSFQPRASDSEINQFISENGWPTDTKIHRIGYNLADASTSMKNNASGGDDVELCPYSEQLTYVENYGRWIYREILNSPDCGGVPTVRKCCTCGSSSTNILMDNFVYAVDDNWFNGILAQYVESGAFAVRQLPSNSSTPDVIPPKWIMTLIGCSTNPTKPEVKRKMNVVLETLQELLDSNSARYSTFKSTQLVRIVASYNSQEFAFKLEDCDSNIATFVVTREICPKAGEELRHYCVEFDLWKTYTDGNCGKYNQLVKANSEDCGYVPCEPAGRKMETYCEGFDQWAFFTDGNCGKTPVKLHENSEDCGYIPCDKRGTVTGTKCKGFDLYDIVADGDCGTEDVLNTPNSPDCGYVPCDPAGIEKRRYCEGKDQYAEYTDGNCGITRQLIMTNSPDCGYGPTCPDRGTIQRTYCIGTTKMGVYHDGACETYESVIESNSAECGYTQPPLSRNAAILTKSRTPTDDPRSGEWPTSAVMIGERGNTAYVISIYGANSESGDGNAGLATFGWDATPGVPDKHYIEILDSSGSVLVSYMIDSGQTDSRGMSWTRDTFGLPAQSSLPDGNNYKMRIFIEVGHPGSTNKAYSQTYRFILKNNRL